MRYLFLLVLLLVSPTTICPDYNFYRPALKVTSISVSRSIPERPPKPSVPSIPKTITVLATAYTHTGNRTRTGTWPKAGRTIAVDPKVIPLGSKVYVEGLGTRIAEDTGGLIRNKRIDVFVSTVSTAKKFGVRKLKVTLAN